MFLSELINHQQSLAPLLLSTPPPLQEFYKWGYGQSIILDAMLLMASELPSSPQSAQSLSQWVNPELDYYLNTPGMAGYNVTHEIPLSPDFIGACVWKP